MTKKNITKKINLLLTAALLCGTIFASGQCQTSFGSLPGQDWDGDGIANYLDKDDDNDGILDVNEGFAGNYNCGTFTPATNSGTIGVTFWKRMQDNRNSNDTNPSFAMECNGVGADKNFNVSTDPNFPTSNLPYRNNANGVYGPYTPGPGATAYRKLNGYDILSPSDINDRSEVYFHDAYFSIPTCINGSFISQLKVRFYASGNGLYGSYVSETSNPSNATFRGFYRNASPQLACEDGPGPGVIGDVLDFTVCNPGKDLIKFWARQYVVDFQLEARVTGEYSLDNGSTWNVIPDAWFSKTSQNANLGDPTAVNARDTDNDGVPDYLDSDSDNDGCVDAIEGSASFTSANLVAGAGSTTVGTGSSAANQNLGNTVVTNSNNAYYGVPTIAGNGQGIGDSRNANVSQCISPIVAVDDAYSSTGSGGTTASVLLNDTFASQPATISNVNLSLVSAPTGFVLNPDGTITVPAATAPGNYIVRYKICDKVNTSNCDEAIATITITGSPDLALNISSSVPVIIVNNTFADIFYTVTNVGSTATTGSITLTANNVLGLGNFFNPATPPTGWTLTAQTGNTYTYTTNNVLAPGANAVFVFNYFTSVLIPQQMVVFNGTVSTAGDGNASNNSDSVTITVLNQ